MDEFTRAYLVTALWSYVGDNGEPVGCEYSIYDVSQTTMEKMFADCTKFQLESGPTLDAAYQTGKVNYGPDFGYMGRAGHDFWLTRNGHGAGFWDGDWPEPFATILTSRAKEFGSCDLYIGDDGQIYA